MDLRAFAEKLREAAARMPEVKVVTLRDCGEMVRDHAKALIGTEEETWAPLADSTVEEKQRLGFTGKVSETDPLLRTNELRSSIQVGEVTAGKVIVGSDDPIAPFQEHGTTRIPPRPFIGTAVFQTEKAVREVIGDAVVRNLKGHGLG